MALENALLCRCQHCFLVGPRPGRVSLWRGSRKRVEEGKAHISWDPRERDGDLVPPHSQELETRGPQVCGGLENRFSVILSKFDHR